MFACKGVNVEDASAKRKFARFVNVVATLETQFSESVGEFGDIVFLANGEYYCFALKRLARLNALRDGCGMGDDEKWCVFVTVG